MKKDEDCKITSVKENENYKVFSITTYGFKKLVRDYGLFNTIWGTDIFINNVPILKTQLLVTILLWLFLIIFMKGL